MLPACRRSAALVSILSTLGALAIAGCDEMKIERRAKPAAETSATAGASRERRLESIRQLTSDGANRQASFSPDAARVVWLGRATSTADFSLRVMNADGTAPAIIETGPGRRFSPVFAPDGQAVLYAAAGSAGTATHGDDDPADLWLFDAALDLWRADLTGAVPRTVLAAPGYDAEPAFSWGGAKLVHASLHGGRGVLILSDADGTHVQRMIEWSGYIGGPQISPDGSRLVFHATPPDGTHALEIYTCDLAGGNLRRLTNLEVMSFAPIWHPSQQFILFASNAEERDFELYVVQPDGSGLERITFSPGFDGFPAFARDGRQLLWTSQRAGGPSAPTQIFRATWRK